MDVCTVCNSRVAPGSTECPNCHSRSFATLGIQYNKQDQKGVSQQPKIPDMYVKAQNLSLPLNMETPIMDEPEDKDDKKVKKEKKEKKEKRERIHKTDEIKMLSDPDENNSDTDIEEIQQSMSDLGIDA